MHQKFILGHGGGTIGTRVTALKVKRRQSDIL